MFEIAQRFTSLLPGWRGFGRSTQNTSWKFPEDRTGTPEQRLFIPVATRSADDLAGSENLDRGRDLARQDLWEQLAQEIAEADAARAKAPGGTPITELLAYGARSDVILAVEHGLSESVAADDTSLIGGISDLEAVLKENGNDPMIGLVVAQAHIDIAWAWRGTGWEATLPQINRERCAAHFDRAHVLLSKCLAAAPNSPAVLSACCALLAGRRAPTFKVADQYEKLIVLDPDNHRHMRAMGNHLLPRWFGSYDELELEARRTASNTQTQWGAGGYTWVQFDAIALDERACARVDVDFFVDGLRDIVEHRPDQEMINILAAYCTLTLQNGLGLNEEADLARVRIADAANWLIREHLTELHPLIWAHAADGFNNSARINSPARFAARGYRQALEVIATLFRDELRGGQKITFTPTGPQFGTQ